MLEEDEESFLWLATLARALFSTVVIYSSCKGLWGLAQKIWNEQESGLLQSIESLVLSNETDSSSLIRERWLEKDEQNFWAFSESSHSNFCYLSLNEEHLRRFKIILVTLKSKRDSERLFSKLAERLQAAFFDEKILGVFFNSLEGREVIREILMNPNLRKVFHNMLPITFYPINDQGLRIQGGHRTPFSILYDQDLNLLALFLKHLDCLSGIKLQQTFFQDFLKLASRGMEGANVLLQLYKLKPEPWFKAWLASAPLHDRSLWTDFFSQLLMIHEGRAALEILVPHMQLSTFECVDITSLQVIIPLLLMPVGLSILSSAVKAQVARIQHFPALDHYIHICRQETTGLSSENVSILAMLLNSTHGLDILAFLLDQSAQRFYDAEFFITTLLSRAQYMTDLSKTDQGLRILSKIFSLDTSKKLMALAVTHFEEIKPNLMLFRKYFRTIYLELVELFHANLIAKSDCELWVNQLVGEILLTFRSLFPGAFQRHFISQLQQLPLPMQIKVESSLVLEETLSLSRLHDCLETISESAVKIKNYLQDLAAEAKLESQTHRAEISLEQERRALRAEIENTCRSIEYQVSVLVNQLSALEQTIRARLEEWRDYETTLQSAYDQANLEMGALLLATNLSDLEFGKGVSRIREIRQFYEEEQIRLCDEIFCGWAEVLRLEMSNAPDKPKRFVPQSDTHRDRGFHWKTFDRLSNLTRGLQSRMLSFKSSPETLSLDALDQLRSEVDAVKQSINDFQPQLLVEDLSAQEAILAALLKGAVRPKSKFIVKKDEPGAAPSMGRKNVDSGSLSGVPVIVKRDSPPTARKDSPFTTRKVSPPLDQSLPAQLVVHRTYDEHREIQGELKMRLQHLQELCSRFGEEADIDLKKMYRFAILIALTDFITFALEKSMIPTDRRASFEILDVILVHKIYKWIAHPDRQMRDLTIQLVDAAIIQDLPRRCVSLECFQLDDFLRGAEELRARDMPATFVTSDFFREFMQIKLRELSLLKTQVLRAMDLPGREFLYVYQEAFYGLVRSITEVYSVGICAFSGVDESLIGSDLGEVKQVANEQFRQFLGLTPAQNNMLHELRMQRNDYRHDQSGVQNIQQIVAQIERVQGVFESRTRAAALIFRGAFPAVANEIGAELAD